MTRDPCPEELRSLAVGALCFQPDRGGSKRMTDTHEKTCRRSHVTMDPENHHGRPAIPAGEV